MDSNEHENEMLFDMHFYAQAIQIARFLLTTHKLGFIQCESEIKGKRDEPIRHIIYTRMMEYSE